MDIVGPELSTVNVVLVAPGSVLPAPSLALPAAMVIPRVPSPVIPLMVTVGVAVAPPVTAIFPVAFPVVFKVILAANRLTVVAPV